MSPLAPILVKLNSEERYQLGLKYLKGDSKKELASLLSAEECFVAAKALFKKGSGQNLAELNDTNQVTTLTEIEKQLQQVLIAQCDLCILLAPQCAIPENTQKLQADLTLMRQRKKELYYDKEAYQQCHLPNPQNSLSIDYKDMARKCWNHAHGIDELATHTEKLSSTDYVPKQTKKRSSHIITSIRNSLTF
jgi:hypothetical protein